MDDDDFFDEEVLKSLDEVDRQYQQSLERDRLRDAEHDKPPPTKRPRLDPPVRQPSIRAAYVPRDDDDDDDPVIVLDAKGKYAIAQQQPQEPPPPSRPPSTTRALPTPPHPPRAPAPATRPAQQQTRPPQPQPVQTRPQIPTRQSHPQASLAHNRARHTTPTLQPSNVQPRPVTQAVAPAPPAPSHASSSSTTRRHSPGRSKLEIQLADMQAQLATLQESNEALTASLRSAEETKWTREGEVANLRRTMEQRNTQHHADIARLKEERRQAEAARLEREKALKEDMERMKTRFIIRQQELETSTRNRTWSSSRRQPGSSQFPAGTQQTPVPAHNPRSTQGWGVQDTPAPANRRRQDKRPAPPPPPTFGGFVNSFVHSSPVKSPVKNRKPKNAVLPTQALGDRSSSPPAAPSFVNAWASTKQPQLAQTPRRGDGDSDDSKWFMSPAIGAAADMDVDAAVVGEEQDDADLGFGAPLADDPDEIHAVIMHHRRKGTATVLSLQVLLAADTSEEYAQACSLLVQRGHVGDAIVHMAGILAQANPLPSAALATLLDLCAYLVFAFPSLGDAFLSVAGPNHALPGLLCVLPSLVSSLTADVVAFLEALGWGVKDQHLSHVATLLRHPGFLQALLDHGGLPALRVLALFASYPPLSEALLERPRDKHKDLVDRLSTVLAGDSESEAQLAALTCIGQLALAHDDAQAALLDSHALMPALVQRVWSLVAGFWDGDAAAPALAMRVLQHSVHVMHHLALSRGATNELRDRLHAGAGGLDYMFAVAVGRLAYADPPERLAQATRDELRKLTEFARDLLELVVDSPEMDDIYNAYQWDEAEREGEALAASSASLTDDEDSLMSDDFAE